MQCLAGEEIIQDLDWDSMTGKLYHWQHNGAFLKKYVLLLKLFFETLVKKKKGGGGSLLHCVLFDKTFSH